MDTDVQVIISGDTEKAGNALKNFLQKSWVSFSFPELNQNNYRKELWRALYGFIRNMKATHLHIDSLIAIRILSRDKTELNELVNDDLLDAIIVHAALKDDHDFDDSQVFSVAMESMKCLSNLIFNSKVAAAICCKNGTLEGIIRRLRMYKGTKIPADIKFIDMKILFITTAVCSEVRPRLKGELHGLTYLIETLDLILKESVENNINIMETNGICREDLTDSQIDLSCEILKVLFNLTVSVNDENVDKEEEGHYLRLVSILHDYLIANVSNVEKKQELDNHLINLIMNLPKSCYKGLLTPISEGDIIAKDFQFEEHNMIAVAKMLDVLRQKFTAEPAVSSQHEILSPVLTALLRAAISDRSIRKYLRMQILPPLRDVHHRPEQGSTLRNCLCRLLTSPISPVKNLSAELLFTLCKENVNRMIKYTGYGNATGLFAARGIMGGKNGDISQYSSDSEDSDTEEYKEFKHGINPVLGCYEPPRPNPTAHMTQEQKEYEAMKLVELMENLTRTGIVKPCKIGEDGRPKPVEHILQLQEGLCDQQVRMDDDSD